MSTEVQAGSLKHFIECLIIYGSVHNQWDNETQQLEYVIPATCLNGFKTQWYFLPKDDLFEMLKK